MTTLASHSSGISGQASHENVLLGMHFIHGRVDCNLKGNDRIGTAGFWDYVQYMPEDLSHMSYADFWHWWSEFERYKGDEKGLREFDAIVDECLKRGMKVKVDLAWSTWWALDKDWEENRNTAHGPTDVNDWIHLCQMLGRRYRGKVALWMLQGEANDPSPQGYWLGADAEHVHEVYRQGYREFRKVDPGTLISIAGASPSVPREALDEWVSLHVNACKPLFDDVPMNYFGDTADPYGGMLNYYQSVRKILDDAGMHEAEVGSGESSFQWAETYETMTLNPPRSMKGKDPQKMPLCELKQAWRCNESLGTFFDIGGNKFVMWGSEYAPGLGWAWRWGFRKFQDWWGVWPDEFKVQGTNIVFGNDKDGNVMDLRPGWTSSEADPFHPVWEVYKFWAQACPPGSEAVRIPVESEGSDERILKLGTYLQCSDSCVVLVQNDHRTKPVLRIDLGRTGWADGTRLEIEIKNQSIDYATGFTTLNWQKSIKAAKSDGLLILRLPAAAGFTTATIRPYQPKLSAEFIGQTVVGTPEVNKTTDCFVTLKNPGASTWRRKSATLVNCGPDGCISPATLTEDVSPGQSTSIKISIPAQDLAGRCSCMFRLSDSRTGLFGPAFPVSVDVSDPDVPRKLVAFREVGHTRLKWFAPERTMQIDHYELYRSEGADQQAALLTRVEGTDYLDEQVEPDKSYYYFVKAVDHTGKAGRPSNQDNAKAISTPRIYDAEIVEHDVPEKISRGQSPVVTVTIKNTGSKSWDLSHPQEMRFFLDTTQQWGSHDEILLPDCPIDSRDEVKPGETVQVRFPYSATREGRFENHWVLSLDIAGEQVYFGTPLLVETLVTSAGNGDM